MFYARLKNDETGRETSALYYYMMNYISDTFSPIWETLDIINFTVSGKTYREKQNDLREKAIRFQSDISSAEGLYMGEYAEIVNWFVKNARRYGLVQEFTENAII